MNVSKVLLAIIASAMPFVGACGTGAPANKPGPVCVHGRTIVVVRHAEKASSERDAPLSERGQARAHTLASLLGHAGVTRLVATQYKRTQETLTPLAARLSLPVEVRDASATKALVDELRAAPDGSMVVVATHSNVLPFIVRELSGQQLHGVAGDALPDDDYSRVIVLDQPCGAAKPSLLELGSGDSGP